MNIKDALKTENVGKNFKFIINGVLSKNEHTIVIGVNGVSYDVNGKEICIDQILKQNEKYNYQVELL